MEQLKDKLDTLKQGYPSDRILFEALVCPGLELVAIREITITLNIDENDSAIWYRIGKLYFCCAVEEFRRVKLLRSVISINIVVDIVIGLNLTGNLNDDKNELVTIGLKTDILYSAKKWALLTQFKGTVDNKYGRELSENKNEPENLRFRVTCERTGCHSFNSRIVEAQFGGAIKDKCQWTVALTNWQLHVLLNLKNHNVVICLFLKKLALEDMNIRNSIDLGPTKLKPTLAYAVLCMARIRPGDHIVDLLCDVGSITIECLYAIRNVTLTSGDFRYKKCNKTLYNIESQPVDLRKPSVFIWKNLLKLPFPNNTVDTVIINMAYFNDMDAVVCNINHKNFSKIFKPKTGRIVILTREINYFLKCGKFGRPECIWRIIEKYDFYICNVKYSLFLAFRKNQN